MAIEIEDIKDGTTDTTGMINFPIGYKSAIEITCFFFQNNAINHINFNKTRKALTIENPKLRTGMII